MRQEIDELVKENKILKDSFDVLTKENKDLTKSIIELKDQMINLTQSICTDLTCKLRSEDYSTLDMIKNEKGKSRKTVRKSSSS